MSRLSSRIAALLLIGTLTACGDDPTGLELEGDFSMVSANGQDVPVPSFMTLPGADGCILDLIEGVLTLYSDGRFAGSLSYERDCAGTTNDGPGFAPVEGTFELTGGVIAFTQTGAPMVMFTGGSLVEDDVHIEILWQPDTNAHLRFRRME